MTIPTHLFPQEWEYNFMEAPMLCDCCKTQPAHPITKTVFIGQTKHTYTFCDALCRNRFYLLHLGSAT